MLSCACKRYIQAMRTVYRLYVLMIVGVISGYTNDYVVPADGNSGIRAVAGERGGLWSVEAYVQPFGYHRYVVSEYYGNYTSHILQRPISIYAGSKFTHLYSPLPTSGLGTRYIFASFEYTDDVYTSVLVIASHRHKTEVTVTFRLQGTVVYRGVTYSDGDTLTISISERKTVKIHSSYDLTGTLINSTEPVAVFSERRTKADLTLAYDQLLPVSSHGQEFVVAVDDNPALYQLQVISEFSDTQIVLSNGSTVSMNQGATLPGAVSKDLTPYYGLYRLQLRQNEILHFNTTRPAMTTLCRDNRAESGFVVVPPVSLHRTQTALIQQGNVKVILYRSANLRVKSSTGTNVSVVMQNIPSSEFRVGTFKLSSSESMSLTSDKPFSTMVFSYEDIHNSGYSLNSGSESSEEYWVPIGSTWAAAGETGARWKVTSYIPPYSQNLFTVNHQNKEQSYSGHVIRATSTEAKMSVYGYNDSAAFSVLPVSDLSSNYIISSCHPQDNYTSVLVVATHKHRTQVTITFRLQGNVTYDGRTYSDGDNLTLPVDPYRTFTVKSNSDLSGTIIRSPEFSVAIFSGFAFKKNAASLEQMLPVVRFGSQYIIAVDDDTRLSQLQVVSEHKDSQIVFSNGSTVSVDDNGLYRQTLGLNETLYFTTTRPVMISLCREVGFAVVPPVSSYVRKVAQVSKGGIVAKIITESDKTEIYDIHIFTNSTTAVDVVWEKVPYTSFQVGTLNLSDKHTLFTTQTNFTILMFSNSYGEISNGGYRFTVDPVCVCCNGSCDKLPIVEIVASFGTGLCVTTAMAFGGFALYRRRRRQREDDEEKEKRTKTKESNERPRDPRPAAPKYVSP